MKTFRARRLQESLTSAHGCEENVAIAWDSPGTVVAWQRNTFTEQRPLSCESMPFGLPLPRITKFLTRYSLSHIDSSSHYALVARSNVIRVISSPSTSKPFPQIFSNIFKTTTSANFPLISYACRLSRCQNPKVIDSQQDWLHQSRRMRRLISKLSRMLQTRWETTTLPFQ